MAKKQVSRTHLSVHASTLAYIQLDGITPKKQLMAAWFAGSREGAKDVQIYASFLDLNQTLTPLNDAQTKNPWSLPKPILSPQMLAQQSGTRIKKLGNPVLYQSKDGTIHLFVVATGYGGWAASKIYHLTSKAGDDFSFKQILPLSPFLNVSHLVRATPVTLADGGFYLPVYHEMLQKFELILRFDQAGNVIQKIRPNKLKSTLQPSITALSADQCLIVRRHRHSSPMLIQTCHQGGFLWDFPKISNINNDNNSPNVIKFEKHPYLVHNQHKEQSTRYYLWLSKLTHNGDDDNFLIKNKILLDTASDENHEVSYPTTLVLGDNIHIVYTHDRTSIRHIMLNKAFIDTYKSCSQPANIDWQSNAPSNNASVFLSINCQGVHHAN